MTYAAHLQKWPHRQRRRHASRPPSSASSGGHIGQSKRDNTHYILQDRDEVDDLAKTRKQIVLPREKRYVPRNTEFLEHKHTEKNYLVVFMKLRFLMVAHSYASRRKRAKVI